MPRPPKRHAVLLTRGAENDLEALHRYLSEFDSPASADRLLDRLLSVVHSLEQSPERGSQPRELLALGIKAYRQVLFKPWRLIYRVEGGAVHVVLIVDGRRDLQSVLAERLLGA
ncbi:MAG: type II toxin-antitoxin system RelE/ParE family toxin [Aquimonas sp.]|nr:type II toxin-antitoxin system RelE/ParE family toxin [Aquimonas sp.]